MANDPFSPTLAALAALVLLLFVGLLGVLWMRAWAWTHGVQHGAVRETWVQLSDAGKAYVCTDLDRQRKVAGCSTSELPGGTLTMTKAPGAGSGAAADAVKVNSNMLVTGSANVQGRLHFGDPSLSKSGNGDNGSDAYYMQRISDGWNKNHLRLTMNDDANESLQIWGDSCASAGGCTGPGVMRHKFDAKGNATHGGHVLLAAKNCVDFGAAGATGRQQDAGKVCYARWSDGLDIVGAGAVASQRKVRIWDQLCIGKTCVTEADLQKLKKLA